MRLLTFRYPVKDKETGAMKHYVPIAFFTEKARTYANMKEEFPALKMAEPLGDYIIDCGDTEVPTDVLLTYKATKEMHETFLDINKEFAEIVVQMREKEELHKEIQSLKNKCRDLEKLIRKHYVPDNTGIEPAPVEIPREIPKEMKEKAEQVKPPPVPKLNQIVMEDGTGVNENPPNIFEGTAKKQGDPF